MVLHFLFLVFQYSWYGKYDYMLSYAILLSLFFLMFFFFLIFIITYCDDKKSLSLNASVSSKKYILRDILLIKTNRECYL